MHLFKLIQCCNPMQPISNATPPRKLMHQTSALLAMCLSTICAIGNAQETDSKEKIEKETLSVLRLQGGDTLRGAWRSSDVNNLLLWECPSFLSPISFPWESIQLIQNNSSQNKTQAERESTPSNSSGPIFCAELVTGEILSGSLVSISKEQLEIQVNDLGKLTIPIQQVQYLLRLSASNDQAVQVLDANQWEQILPATRNGRATKWYLKAGEIATDTSGTTISQWTNLPELATIDIDVSWDQTSPNWWLTLGEPRRMELQVRKLQNRKLLNVTLLLENSKDADVTTIQLPYEEDQSLKLKLLCDANKGVYVLMRENQVLGRLRGNPKEQLVGRTKVSFTNTALGVLTLRDLRVSRSAFAIPAEVRESSTKQIEWMTANRGTFFGDIQPSESANSSDEVSSNSASIKVLGGNGAPIDIPINEIERVEFPNPIDESTNPYAVELIDGKRFASKTIESYSDQGNRGVVLEVLSQKLRFAMQDIKRISRRSSSLPDEANEETDAGKSRISQRLVTDEVISLGKVADVKKINETQNTFSWLPRFAKEPVPLNPQSDGAIEPILTQSNPDVPRRSKNTDGLATLRADAPASENDFGKPLKPEDPSLFLLSGDCFPALVRRGDDTEVYFESPLFPKQSIDQSLVRGIRFLDYRGIEKLDRATRNRMLTVPRLQRNNPPTHLVVSRDGDLLRGKLLHFDRDQMVLDVRGEGRTVLVKNIAELIRLDQAPKLDAAESVEPEVEDSVSSEQEHPASSYQVILDQGARVSLIPTSVDALELRGRHPQLGDCALPWSSVLRVSLGDAISIDASRNRYGKWKLQHAPDPKYINEAEEGNDRPSDTPQMRLIGQGAPDFDLMKIDGTPFRLKEMQGKILILDFWATWCGPCIRSIPTLIDVSKEYKEAGVELVLVNLEEPENRVRPFLERFKTIPTVVLDTDGSVSKQYAVSAIPHTVLIDRDGGIADIFVGASEENEEALRKKIDELLK